MLYERLPKFILDNYECHEWKHASAILKNDFPNEWNDLISVLTEFRLKREWIAVGGGSKSRVSAFIDSKLYDLGWKETQFDTGFLVDGTTYRSPTHKVDCYKNKVAIEIEWNNKDPFLTET